MLTALNYCHRRAIVHRDVKLENFFLDYQETDKQITVKLADFGIAQQAVTIKNLSGVAGTLAYMAPEVITRQKYDQKADCWSLGVILYEMLTNKHPYLKNSESKLSLSALQRM